MAYQKLQAYRALKVLPSNTVDIPNPAMLAISSTTTGTSAGKLVDSTQNFTTKGIKEGDIVYNTSAGTSMEVTAVDSATQLSVSGTVASAANYEIYASVDTPNNGCVLYVGTAGDLLVTTAGGDTVEFIGVLAGSFIPVQVTRVFRTGQTGTAATQILALW
tara:strand:+ start:1084 stop:1566 length:483 start_codon:yes stop_codon:yes gene_type:complete